MELLVGFDILSLYDLCTRTMSSKIDVIVIRNLIGNLIF